MTNTPILLVEDNPHDQEFTLTALQKCKIFQKVIVVNDGEEALQYLNSEGKYAARQQGNPSLVLLDLKLPKIDGVELLKKIRFTPEWSSIPVVVLSTSSLESDLHRTKVLGISEYVVKSIDMKAFTKSICNVIPPLLDRET